MRQHVGSNVGHRLVSSPQTEKTLCKNNKRVCLNLNQAAPLIQQMRVTLRYSDLLLCEQFVLASTGFEKKIINQSDYLGESLEWLPDRNRGLFV